MIIKLHAGHAVKTTRPCLSIKYDDLTWHAWLIFSLFFYASSISSCDHASICFQRLRALYCFYSSTVDVPVSILHACMHSKAWHSSPYISIPVFFNTSSAKHMHVKRKNILLKRNSGCVHGMHGGIYHWRHRTPWALGLVLVCKDTTFLAYSGGRSIAWLLALVVTNTHSYAAAAASKQEETCTTWWAPWFSGRRAMHTYGDISSHAYARLDVNAHLFQGRLSCDAVQCTSSLWVSDPPPSIDGACT
jgi:hypothetical protein